MGMFSRSKEIEVRDPTAATRNLRWITPNVASPPDWSAETAFEVAYYSNIAVYACFQAIASTISSLPFRAGADPDKPDDFNTNAPLARLLGPPPGGPNVGMSGEELWHFAIIQYLVTGRFGWEIETDGNNRVAALWPLVSSSLVPVPTRSGTAWFKEFTYGRIGDQRTLPTDRVLYAWQPRGSDYRQPESALEAAGLDVSIAVMQSRYDYAFLKNDARPAALVVTESFSDESEYRAFQDQWNASYGGPQNAGKSAFLEAEGSGDQGVKGAVDVTVLGISPKDAQAAQRYSDRLQQIAIGLGVPWSRLDASGRTFDNASQEDLIWWQQRLGPLLRRLQSAVNIQLAPRLGPEVGWFDLSGVSALKSKPDPITAQVGAPALVQAQVMTKNEARADYGLPPVADGDRFMTAEEIVALRGGGIPSEPPVRVREVEKREPEPTALPASPAPALEPPNHEARRAKLWTNANSRVAALERQWERALRKLFARQQRAVLLRLESKRGRQAIGEARAADEVFDPTHWLDETIDDVQGLYESVAAAGGTRVSDLFGISFDLEAPYVQDFIQARANQLAGQVTTTTYEAVKAALADGVAEGEGIPALSERIRHVFDVASKSRATTIARTEVISAFNGSASLTAAEYGTDVVAGQEWIATRDARTRDQHVERDGEIVAVGALFSGGLAYPGDPSGSADDTINCRCSVAFLTPEEMADLGRSRMVERRLAHAVLALVRPGHDERTIRQALRAAA